MALTRPDQADRHWGEGRGWRTVDTRRAEAGVATQTASHATAGGR